MKTINTKILSDSLASFSSLCACIVYIPMVSPSLTQTCIITISGKILLTFCPWVSVTCGGGGVRLSNAWNVGHKKLRALKMFLNQKTDFTGMGK